jgi:hypothetical protein
MNLFSGTLFSSRVISTAKMSWLSCEVTLIATELMPRILNLPNRSSPDETSRGIEIPGEVSNEPITKCLFPQPARIEIFRL